jgi:subtilisin
MRRLIVLAAVLSLLLSVGPVNAVAPDQAGGGGSTDARAADRYIVLLREGSDVDGTIGRLSRRVGIRPDHAYRNAVRGFSAHLDARQLADVKADPSVALVEADRVVQLESQTLPTGVDRVDADLSPAAKIDGLDERVDADIAIIDTGIQADHPDLNVAGGHNCINADPADWGDGYGHGTHVAGIAAALDNGIGVVGVAPGARVWAVRVFDSTGFSLLSWIVCGIDWVTSQKDPTDSTRPLFEAANMSLRDAGSNDGNCGYTNGDAEHQAICRSVAAGITYAVAAGNDGTDAGRWIPAAYPEVITVSALADFNGKPGGGAPSTCSSFNSADSDDTFADFSNFGPAVDLIAPGKCIYSTYPTSLSTRTGYAVLSGTSMATPHVAGAIALYKVGHPTATPSEVQAALRAAGTLDWFTNTDPDATHERLLNVSSFGAAPGVSISAGPSSASLPDAGGTATYAITIVRGNGFSDSIGFVVAGIPSGATATFSSNPVSDLAGLTSLLSVTVPAALAPATYGLTITGASGTLSSTASVTLVKTPPALAITATSLPAGTVNKPYSATVEWTGGTSPYTWKIASGALPPGLTLDASTGTISGLPTKPGNYSFTVSVSDGATQMATQAFSIRITKK